MQMHHAAENWLPRELPDSTGRRPYPREVARRPAPVHEQGVRPLRAQALLLLLAALLPTLLVAVLVAVEQRQADRASADLATRQIVSLVAQRQLEATENVRSLLTVFATDRLWTGGRGECTTRARQVLPLLKNYLNVGVIDADGVIRCSAVQGEQEHRVDDPSLVRRVAASRGFSIGDFAPGPVTGRPTILVGRPLTGQRVLFAALDLSTLVSEDDLELLPPGSVVNVADTTGRRLARAPERADLPSGSRFRDARIRTAVQRGAATAVLARGDDGVERYYTILPLEVGQSGRLSFSAGVPASSLYADSDALTRRLAVGFAVAILALLLVSFIGVDYLLLRPVKRLVSTAEAVTAGRLGTRAPREVGELGRLALSLNKMISSMQELVTRLTTAEDRERRAVAEDVHDDSLQLVVAAQMRVEVLPATAPASQHEALDNIARPLERASVSLRRIMSSLSVPEMSQGLVDTLRELVDEVFDDASVAATVTGPDHDPLHPAARAAAYRVAREALHNARKHADATYVAVAVAVVGDATSVSIVDDGVGADSLETRQGHLGLTAIRSRVLATGGTLDVTSARGQGTRVTARWPAPRAAEPPRDALGRAHPEADEASASVHRRRDHRH